MVYCGRPFIGCEPCRHAKKKCTLERPVCLRCARLNKACLNYRHDGGLRFRDETYRITAKLDGRSHSQCISATNDQDRDPGSRAEVPQPQRAPSLHLVSKQSRCAMELSLSRLIMPQPEVVAVNYFLSSFMSDGYWRHVPERAFMQGQDDCLASAVRACGMAALANVQDVSHARAWYRSMYAKALSLVNLALGDPTRNLTDDTLIAVLMLSFFEVPPTWSFVGNGMLIKCKEPHMRRLAIDAVLEDTYRRRDSVDQITGQVTTEICYGSSALP